MKLKTLEILGLGALGYFLFTKLGSYLGSQVTVGTIKFQITNTTPAGTTVRLFIPVKNAANIAYPLERFQGFLFYGAYQLGLINVAGPITIPANGLTTVTTDVYISFANLSSQLAAMIINGEWLNAIHVKGTLTASGVNIPISQNISLV